MVEMRQKKEQNNSESLWHLKDFNFFSFLFFFFFWKSFSWFHDREELLFYFIFLFSKFCLAFVENGQALSTSREIK